MKVKMSLVLMILTGIAFAGEEPAATLSSPGFPPSTVAENGAIEEPWGSFMLALTEPTGMTVAEQRFEEELVPTAVTTKRAGDIVVEETAYRAPVWPGGVDVLCAEIRNTGDVSARALLEVQIPESVGVGDRIGSAGGRPVLALPLGIEPVREEREWGCTGGPSALPGWAKPNADCDSAFKNIRAGMGGIPITYTFHVDAGGRRKVVLGLCESHWTMAGQRPLILRVEGAPERDVDPIAEWGQHGPGSVVFEAIDADKDGRLDITVDPHPRAQDKNSILNVIWVFEPGLAINGEEVVAGKLNDRAEYYVDVGGERDQALYKGGNLRYALELQPEEFRQLLFLLRSPGGGAVPDPANMAWNPASLRKAAEDVWRDW
ncbi:MAG: hypothetical protein R6V12_11545 [Candidatus Hydrogenedentota bacterium]